MTSRSLVVCPRTAEGADLVAEDDGDGAVLGSLMVNGTLLAGTALVKREKEWDAIRAGSDGMLRAVLAKVGVPRAS